MNSIVFAVLTMMNLSLLSPTSSRPSDVWTHRESGISFPASAGSFVRQAAEDSPDRGAHTTYTSDALSTFLSVDLVPVEGGDSARAQLDRTLSSVKRLDLYKDLRLLKRESTKLKFNGDDVHCERMDLSFIEDDGTGTKMHLMLLVFRRNQYFVSACATFPVPAVEDGHDDAILGVFRSLR